LISVSASRPFVASRRAWLFAVLAALLVLATEQVVEHYAQRSELEEERSDVLNRLSTLRARLEAVVNINLSLVHGLTAVIESRPDIDQAGFAAIADGLVGERYALRNIGAAPGMVLSLMYPLAGNEAALGLDYRSHPQQREAALRARDSGRTVIAGPVDLQQGGVAIIARKPVFLPPLRPGGEKRFWGLVSAAIDVETLYQRAGLLDADHGLRLALRGSDASGADGPLFFGDAALFNADPVSVEVTLPGGGSWQMVAVPAEGWGRLDTAIVLLRTMSYLLALLAAVVAFRLVRGGELLASHSARLDALLKTIPDLVWLKDGNGVYLNCNPRFESLFGASEAEIRGKTDHHFVPADMADFVREKDRAAIAAGGPSINEEWVCFASDGHRELLETIKAPVFDERGGLVGVLGIARDITQRKRDEAELQRQKDLLDRTGRLANVGGWEFDVVSQRGSWSDETARIHDLEPGGEVCAAQGLSYFHGAARRTIEQAVQVAIERGQPYDLEVELTSAKGVRKWIRTIGLPVLEDGKVVRLEGAVQDISQRQLAEARARQGELVLDSVFQALPDLFFLMDADGTIRDYRAQKSAKLYVPPDTFLGKRMPDVLPAAVGELLGQKLQEVGEHGGLVTCEYDLPMVDGVLRYEARLTALPDSVHVIAVVRDISERVAAAALMEKQWKMLSDSQRMAHIGSWELDLPSGPLAWSEEAYRIYGVSPESFTPSPEAFMELVHPDDLPAVQRVHAEIIAGQQPRELEFRIIRPDGTPRSLLGRGALLHGGDGRPIRCAGTVQDVTERTLAENALREQEAFFRLLAENMGDMVAVLDLQGGHLYDSPAYRALFGESATLPGAEAFASVHPDDRDRVRQAFQTTIATGIGQRGTFRVVLPDGSVHAIESQGGVIRNAEGRVERVVVVSRDVSERIRMEDEIRQLNSDLEARVHQRTAELDAANKELQTFTYSVSHDLKAPLRGIDGYSRLLLEDHREQLDEEGRLFLDKVRHGVAHMGRLIEDLLAYSRLERRHLHGRTLDLAEQVGMVLDSRRVDLQAAGMVIEVRLQGLSASADPEGLDMVLRNLVDNALKFSRASKPPQLAVSGSQTGQSVTLAFKDNGIGFDMRFHERIFEIFQRLQRAEDYPGTGIGLAIVHKAVQRMGGRIWAESQPGHGATFYLELPR